MQKDIIQAQLSSQGMLEQKLSVSHNFQKPTDLTCTPSNTPKPSREGQLFPEHHVAITTYWNTGTVTCRHPGQQ